MNSDSAKGKILWAFDPFEGKGETRQHVAALAREFSKQGTRVEPVYVFAPNEYVLALDTDARWFDHSRPTVQKVFSQALQGLRLPGLGEAKIIKETSETVTGAVGALVACAKASAADFILVGTHARRGISRVFLGSFAETLILRSEVPVMVVGPHAGHSKIRKILFATDFGKDSERLFSRAVAFARSQKARITLFHALHHTLEPAFEAAGYLVGGAIASWPDFVTREEQRKRQAAARFVETAKAQGVAVKACFTPTSARTSDAILKQAKAEKADLVAVAPRSGALAAALAGSVTRQVVRGAQCPVWVVRPGAAT
jgi:nucleotide-binding universal stress UspA family protein